MKEYPKYLQIGNWLFMHIEPNRFIQDDKPVGGSIPDNLYLHLASYSFDLSKNLRTYEGLIAYGAVVPSDEELLRIMK